jgi:DNA-binding MarR family transcriptional regulator
MDSHFIYDTNSLDNAVAFIIERTGRLLRYNLARLLRESGSDISPEQWFILFRLHEHPAVSQGELADRTLHDHPNITRLLDGLERRNFVRRTSDPTDRRRTLISLTDDGQRFVNQLFPVVFAERARILRTIEPAEIATLVATLRKIEQNLEGA